MHPFFLFLRSLLFILLLTFSRSVYSEVSLQPVFITFIVNGEEVGEVATYLDEKDLLNSEVLLDSFVDSVGEQFDSQILAKLQKKSQHNRFKLVQMNDLGLKTSLDLNQLEAQIELPIDFRSTQNISFQTKINKNSAAYELSPSWSSAAINFLVNKPVAGDSGSQLPLTAQIESAIRVGDLVLEDQRQYTEYDPYAFKRQQTRFVYDDEQKLLRYQLGDLKYQVTGFQSIINLGGVSVAKEFSINPMILVSSDNRNSFTLKSSAQVDILIGAQKFRTLQLNAGRYELSDLPLGAGYNEIQLVITDSFGRTETLNFSYVANSELLKEGLSKYSHNIGVPSAPNRHELEYAEKNWVYTGYYNRGLSDKWTSGLNIQNSEKQYLLGFENYFGVKFGTFLIDLAYSEIKNSFIDRAWRLKYKSWPTMDKWVRDWGFSFESYGEKFASLGQLTPSNTTELLSDIFLSPDIGLYDINTTLGFSQRQSRALNDDSQTAYVRFQKSTGANFSVSTDFNTSHNENGTNEWTWNINLNWLNFDGKLSQNINYEAQRDTKHYDLQATAQTNLLNAALDSSQESDSAQLRAHRSSNRYNMSVDYQTSKNKIADLTSQSGNVSLGTALVWTSDSGVSISAPVFDSFALFELDDSLKEDGLELNRQNEISEYSSDIFGNLLIPNIDSYRERVVLLESKNDSAVRELDQAEFVLKAKYKSGLYKKVSLYSSFIVTGRILLPNGNPFVLGVFDVCEPSDLGRCVSYFTNKSGEFEVDRLQSGTYVLKVKTYKPKAFLIPDNIQNVYSLEEIKLEGAKK